MTSDFWPFVTFSPSACPRTSHFTVTTALSWDCFAESILKLETIITVSQPGSSSQVTSGGSFAKFAVEILPVFRSNSQYSRTTSIGVVGYSSQFRKLLDFRFLFAYSRGGRGNGKRVACRLHCRSGSHEVGRRPLKVPSRKRGEGSTCKTIPRLRKPTASAPSLG